MLFVVVVFAEGFSSAILEFLKSRGHNVSMWDTYSVVQGVVIDKDSHVTAHADSRKKGGAVIVEL